MKKLLALILAIVMLLSFTACGEDKSAKDDNDGDSKPKTSSVEDKGDDVSSKEEVKPVIAKEGVLENGVYINEHVGIKIELSDAWTDTIGKDLTDFNDGKVAFDNSVDEWYDYMATNEAGEMLFVVFEKTDDTLEEYLAEGKQEIIDSAKGDMLTIDSCEIVDKTIAGKTVKCIETLYSEEDGIDLASVVIEGENAMIVITVFCTESGIDAVLKNIVAA